MALIESGRKSKRKRLRFSDWNGDPDDDEYVDVPAIVEIDVKDPKANNQESTYRFNNSKIAGRIADRVVRVQTVKAATVDGDGVVTLSDSDAMDFERIKQFGAIDPKSNNQETRPRLRGDDPPPTTPDNDDGGRLRHRKTHCIRYTKDNTAEGRPAVDVELIDECETRDPKSNAQESVLRLKHPDPDTLEQIVDASDPYAVNYDLRLGYCDPDLELYEEAVSDNIDPPFRLDPFMNVVNVLRDAYRLVVILVRQSGTSDYHYGIQWLTPKTFYSESEVNAATQDDPLPAPEFGEWMEVHTGPYEIPDDPGSPPEIPPGDYINEYIVAAPNTSINWKGFSELGTQDVIPDETFGWITVNAEVIDYDRNADVIPALPETPASPPYRGHSVASDENGTVFLLNNPATIADPYGFTKYDAEGNILWNLNNGAATFQVIPATETTPARIKMLYIGSYMMDVYDLNGNFIGGSTVFAESDFHMQDVTRKGLRIYGYFDSPDFDTYNGLRCYDEDGTTILWQTTPESVDTGWETVGGLIAFGEDYVVTIIRRNENFETIFYEDCPGNVGKVAYHRYGVSWGYRVYNAYTGEMVSQSDTFEDYEAISGDWTCVDLGEHGGDDHEHDFEARVTHSYTEKLSYGNVWSINRSQYWP